MYPPKIVSVGCLRDDDTISGKSFGIGATGYMIIFKEREAGIKT